jgi:outer membrane protein OmpA-like peptidoglycan-associated protein
MNTPSVRFAPSQPCAAAAAGQGIAPLILRGRFLLAAGLSAALLVSGMALPAVAGSEPDALPWAEEGARVQAPAPPARGPMAYPERPPPPAPRVRWGWQGNVLFDFGSARLRRDAGPLLDSVAYAMTNNPGVSLLITARTDNIGKLESNRRLAERRAQAVAAYLTAHGVERERIHARSVGEQRPVAGNRYEEDRQRNRSADLAFFPTGSEPPPQGELVSGETEPHRGH